MAAKDHCEICEEPGKFNLRIETLEENYDELRASFKEYKQEIYKKFDSLKTTLIINLTAVIISLLLLLANLIAIYGGK